MPVGIPRHGADHSERQFRLRDECARAGIDDPHHARAILIAHDRHALAVRRKREVLDVPAGVLQHHARFLGCKIEAHELHELTPAIRECVRKSVVRPERRLAPRFLFRARRRERFRLAARDVEQVHAALVRRDVFAEQQPFSVVRPALHAPSAGAHLEDLAIFFRREWIHDAHVAVLRVAARRSVGKLLAVARPACARIA